MGDRSEGQRRFNRASVPASGLVDNDGGDHAKHTVRRFGVRQDVAVECPHAWLLAINDRVISFARRDVERIA